MNNVFRASHKIHDHALRGEEGNLNYRNFGHWADLADESESAKEFERSVLREQVEHLKKYVVKRTDIKGRGADYTDKEKTTIAKGDRSFERLGTVRLFHGEPIWRVPCPEAATGPSNHLGPASV